MTHHFTFTCATLQLLPLLIRLLLLRRLLSRLLLLMLLCLKTAADLARL
jgi:hypothetical protein